MKSTERRKKYLINKKIQFNLIASMLTVIVITLLVFSGVVMGIFWGLDRAGDNVFKEWIIVYRQVEESGLAEVEGSLIDQITSRSEPQPPQKRWEIILPALLWNNLFLMVGMVIAGIFITHKLAGPAYSMNRQLREIIKGNRSKRIVIRKTDAFTDLAQNINLLLDQIEE